MLKKTLTYFLFFNLIQFLLIEINCLTTPTKRHLHAASYIDNKLYILGGLHSKGGDPLGAVGVGGTQFIYLDVSAPFDTSALVWNDISSNVIFPPIIGATGVKGSANNNTIFLYGGRNLTQVVSQPSVYTFDTKTGSWNVPTISGESSTKKSRLTAIIDSQGKIYLFGGKVLGDDALVNDTYVNNMITLDTINLSWGEGSSLNAPTARINYGATLLPNQNIIYIGGEGNFEQALSLNEVYIYDTKNNIWSTKVTSGSIPSSRSYCTVVLGLDGKHVIVFGGVGNQETMISPEEALYTLDINTFEWSVPKVSGNIPICRYKHLSTVIGNYMFVNFGFGYYQSESDILLLDISNKNEFVWTTNFNPSTLPPSTPSKNKSLVIGLSVGAGLLAMIAIGALFLYRRNKNSSKVKVGNPNGKLDSQSGQRTVETTNKVDNQEETTQVQP